MGLRSTPWGHDTLAQCSARESRAIPARDQLRSKNALALLPPGIRARFRAVNLIQCPAKVTYEPIPVGPDKRPMPIL